MMSEIESLLIPNEIEDGADILVDTANSNLKLYSQAEKMFYKFSLGDYKQVRSFRQFFPMFLTEFGTSIALDITSETLLEKISELISRQSKHIIKIKLTNISDINHAVCYGNIKEKEVSEKISGIYNESSLISRFITPSLKHGNNIISPTRWFKIENKIGIETSPILVCINVGLILLSEEDIYHRSTDNKISGVVEGGLYKSHATFVRITSEGDITYTETSLNFATDPRKLKLLDREKTGYFLCQFYSFINLKSGKSENLVTTIEETFLYTEDIILLLFPYLINDLNKTILEFSINQRLIVKIKENLLKKVREFNKIGYIMDKGPYTLIRITKDLEELNVSIVNPFVISFLIKQLFYESDDTDKSSIYSVFDSADIFEKLKRLSTNRLNLLKNKKEGYTILCDDRIDIAIDILKRYIGVYTLN